MIHFFSIDDYSSDGKKAFLTLPGQTLGKNPLPAGILVRPARGLDARFRKFKEKYPKGTAFYTRTLRYASGCYTASDITPCGRLAENDGTIDFDIDARLQWERWKVANGKIFPAGTTPGEAFDALYDLAADLRNCYCINLEAYRILGIARRNTFGLTDGFVYTDLRFIGFDPSERHIYLYCRKEKNPDWLWMPLPLSLPLIQSLYEDCVAIFEEVEKRKVLLTQEDSAVIDGMACVPVQWPYVQDLFSRKGFRSHSCLCQGEDYDQYGDCSYWVDYRWLYRLK